MRPQMGSPPMRRAAMTDEAEEFMACNDSVALRMSMGMMHVKSKEAQRGRDREMQLPSFRARQTSQPQDPAISDLCVLDTTASLSAREAAEVAAEERQLWEARMKEERQHRERLEREYRDSLQLAAVASRIAVLGLRFIRVIWKARFEGSF
eukprot:Skav229542  [mRNA]  locus=scaffold568:198772:203476:+ [translate_table: standard]